MEGSITDEQAHLWLQEIADSGFISLHYESPALGAVGKAEISGGGYKRVQCGFSRPANRAIWSLEDVSYTGLRETRLTHFGVWNELNQGRLVAYAPLPETKLIINGWGFVLHGGELAISIG